MKIIVFGASGQDGRLLVEILSQDTNFEVVAVSRSATERGFGRQRNIIYIQHTDYSVEGITRLFDCEAPDVVFNLIGQSSVGRSFFAKQETFIANFTVPKNICEALLRFPGSYFFHASSAYIFDCSTSIGPNSKLSAVSPYALSKLQIYSHIRQLHALTGRCSILHLFNHISEFSDQRFLFPKIVRSFLKSPLEHVNINVDSALPVRNWGFSIDYMNSVKQILMMNHDQRRPEYFIGSNLHLSVYEVLELTSAQLGKTYSLHSANAELRPHDPPRVEMKQSLLLDQGIKLPLYEKHSFISDAIDLFSSCA